MTSSPQLSDPKTTAPTGFSPRMVQLIQQAQTLNRYAIYLVYLAIAMFLLFGTLKSLSQFKDSHTIYTLFHTVPYTLLGLTIPLSCYVAFILYRYRLSQPSMLALCIGMGFLLFAISSYVALAAWIGVAFMFRANLNRFFTYLNETNHA